MGVLVGVVIITQYIVEPTQQIKLSQEQYTLQEMNWYRNTFTLCASVCVYIYVYTCCVSWFEVISLRILLSRLSKSNIQNHNNKYKGERSMIHYIIIIIISIIEMSCNIILQRVHYLNLIQI